MQFIEDHETLVARLVRRRRRPARLRRQPQHRASRCARSACKDGVAQVRVGATLLYDSDPDAEERETHLKASALARRDRGVPTASCAERAARARSRPVGAGKRDPARRPPGLVRAHAGQLPAPDRRRGDDAARRGFPHADARRARARPRGAVAGSRLARRTSTSRARSRRCARGACRCSASASACRAWSSTSAASSACSTTRCTASRRGSEVRGGELFDGPAEALPRRPLPLALRAARRAAARAARHRRDRGRRRDGDRARAACRSPRCSSTRSRS